jgi:hypothetical protein
MGFSWQHRRLDNQSNDHGSESPFDVAKSIFNGWHPLTAV